MSAIEWTGKTWNPTLGCSRISPGCGGARGVGGCYAEIMAHRLALMGQADYVGLTRKNANGDVRWTGVFRQLPARLSIPLERRKPTTWFVDSMSDLFHERADYSFISAVYGVAAACPWHTFQILTKRPENRLDWHELHAVDAAQHCAPPASFVCGTEATNYGADVDALGLPATWPLPNVWEGTSVENRKHGVPRIDVLRRTPAAVRFLSIEPLLEDLGELDLTGIHWVIAGAESGRGARSMRDDWVRSIRDQCVAQGVRFFFKQKATPAGRKVSLPVLDGRQWAEMPEPAR